VFGVAEAGEVVEGLDRGEAGVAGPDRVLALVVEERGDQVGVEHGEIELCRVDMELVVGVGE
jgi:hypothetical protein